MDCPKRSLCRQLNSFFLSEEPNLLTHVIGWRLTVATLVGLKWRRTTSLTEVPLDRLVCERHTAADSLAQALFDIYKVHRNIWNLF